MCVTWEPIPCLALRASGGSIRMLDEGPRLQGRARAEGSAYVSLPHRIRFQKATVWLFAQVSEVDSIAGSGQDSSGLWAKNCSRSDSLASSGTNADLQAP